ncbi:MAG: hypothetical protein R3F17_06885 [Planctomycetota bacterium]
MSTSDPHAQPVPPTRRVGVVVCMLLAACGADPKPGPAIPSEAPSAPGASAGLSPTPEPGQAPQREFVCVQSRSRVEYAASPGDPHQLDFTLGDRQHARLRLAAGPSDLGRRILQHLSDGQAFGTDPQTATSAPLTREATAALLAQTRLRAVLFGWATDQMPADSSTTEDRRAEEFGDGSGAWFALEPGTSGPTGFACGARRGP